VSLTTDTRNARALYRYRTRKTRWLHDWARPEPRIRPKPDTATRACNWLMLAAAAYMVAHLIRWAL
jgi:hypothetical protein